MTPALKSTARALTPFTAAGIIAGLGYPVIAAVVGLAVLILAAGCWIINSSERTDRLARIILARHGNPKCLQPDRRETTLAQ